jgi:uncharacterized iron-regulated membrane protein
MSHLTRMIRFIRHWHARVGVLAALFFLLLASTGLALNHTDTLALAKQQVSASWLMRWYGLKGAVPQQGYLIGNGYVVGDSHRWIMDGHAVPAAQAQLLGVVEVNGLRYLATSDQIRIYQPDGVSIDKMTGGALPALPLHRIGKRDGLVLVDTPQGVFSSADGLTWNQAGEIAIAWSKPQFLPPEIKAKIEEEFAPGLPLERVVLDIHSGRIFGRHGPLVMDMAAIFLAILSISGVWIYLRSIRRRQG